MTKLAPLSVIICTRNRAAFLRDCLDGVLANNVHPEEILVIDQSDTCDSQDLISGLGYRSSRLRYIRDEQRGRGKALNRGIAESSQPLLAFTDDDCSVSPDWISTICRELDERSDVAVVTGRVIAGRPEDNGLSPRALDLSSERRLHLPGRFPRLYVLAGGNSAFRTEVFSRVGVFHPLFGAGAVFRSADDVEMGYRLLRQGQAMLYSPDMLVVHRSWRPPALDLAVCHAYGFGLGAFFAVYIRQGDLRMMLEKPYTMAYFAQRVVYYAARRNQHEARANFRSLTGLVQGYVFALRYPFGRWMEECHEPVDPKTYSQFIV